MYIFLPLFIVFSLLAHFRHYLNRRQKPCQYHGCAHCSMPPFHLESEGITTSMEEVWVASAFAVHMPAHHLSTSCPGTPPSNPPNQPDSVGTGLPLYWTLLASSSSLISWWHESNLVLWHHWAGVRFLLWPSCQSGLCPNCSEANNCSGLVNTIGLAIIFYCTHTHAIKRSPCHYWNQGCKDELINQLNCLSPF